jgi:hypothetical protein
MPYYSQGGVSYSCPECNNANEAYIKAEKVRVEQAQALQARLNSILQSDVYLSQLSLEEKRLESIKHFQDMEDYVLREQALQIVYEKESQEKLLELEKLKSENMIEAIVEKTVVEKEEIKAIITNSYKEKEIIKDIGQPILDVLEYNPNTVYLNKAVKEPNNIIGFGLLALCGLLVIYGVLK